MKRINASRYQKDNLGCLDRLVILRAEIFDGDLRPLYIAHLAVACDGQHDFQHALIQQLTTPNGFVPKRKGQRMNGWPR